MKSFLSKILAFIVLTFTSSGLTVVLAQGGWEWEELTSMPEPVSNNAVTEGYGGDTLCIYSFTGIASGLAPNDIHLKSWRYNTILDEWTQLPDVEDFRGKIAAGASTVNNQIILIGGYYVFDNFNEQSSPKVHRFDCETNTWLPDGADLPVATDDHVQAVWRDSLVFVISGWSQNTNIDEVQIYNPYTDVWVQGTPVPNNNNFKAFGASGTIIGDTIYYFGGVQINSFSFTANSKLRKGVINPENPTEIEWTQLPDAEGEKGYRMAATSFENEAIWIGGAGIAYNFDGLAYSNGAGVEPLTQIRTYNAASTEWEMYSPTPFGVMDMRGIARESENSWIIAGGMSPGQTVSNKVYRITRGETVSVFQPEDVDIQLSQSFNILNVKLPNDSERRISELEIRDMTGRLALELKVHTQSLELDLSEYQSGLYLLNFYLTDGHVASRKIWNP